LLNITDTRAYDFKPYLQRWIDGDLMKGFDIDLEKETKKNSDFRRVLYTGKNSQLVLMCLAPGEEIGSEVHTHIDQFFRFEEGEGKVVIDGVSHKVKDRSGVIVPAGAKHNVVNTSKRAKLKLYTIYSPPEHIDKTIRHTKADALAEPEEFDGKTTE
jgi:mannose-6-phosphate isomerase-like protein (cupin superfamily)